MSPTVQQLSTDDVAEVVERLARELQVVSATPLTGGGFAAVWAVDDVDGRQLALTVGQQRSRTSRAERTGKR